jgi:hypothetical protein
MILDLLQGGIYLPPVMARVLVMLQMAQQMAGSQRKSLASL